MANGTESIAASPISNGPLQQKIDLKNSVCLLIHYYHTVSKMENTCISRTPVQVRISARKNVYLQVHGLRVETVTWVTTNGQYGEKSIQTARPKVGPESQGEELGMPKQEANGRERGREGRVL